LHQSQYTLSHPQYRARQTRIDADSRPDPDDRARLFRDAEVALRRCLDLDPEDGRAYVSLGKILVQSRRFNEAMALYEEGSTATGGTNAHIWTAWAYLAGNTGRVALARRLYDAAVVASPSHAAAYHGWGMLEKRQGDLFKARDVWTRGIVATRERPNSYLYQSLAVMAAESGKVEEARKWFRAGTKTVMGAGSHALWHAWAMLERQHGSDPDIPRMLFRQALEVSPRSRYTYQSWALWEKERGNVEEARRLLRAGARANGRDPALWQAWALLEEEAGDVEEARRLFRRGSRADPGHLYIWQAWGCMEFRQGRLDAARQLFQQGVWAAPSRSRDAALLFQAWAVLESSAGNKELARELFKCAVKADRGSQPSWLAWAAMEEDLGLVDRAAELRAFAMQERVEVVAPPGFTTLPPRSGSGQGMLSPLFQQLGKWFQRYEEAGENGSGGGVGRRPVPLVSVDEDDVSVGGARA
jgi:tetratricopeptide (TPR) repeat protein